MKARTSLWASMAIAASIGLAGCGGSSNKTEEMTAEQKCTAAGGTFADDKCTTLAETQLDDIKTKAAAVTTNLAALTGTTTDGETDSTPTAGQLTAAKAAIDALETAVNGASALSADEKAGYTAQVASARAALKVAQDARDNADTVTAKATTDTLKKTGEDLHKALEGTGDDGSTALANIEDDRATIEDDGNLSINAPAGAGTRGTTNDPGPVMLKPKTGTVPALSGLSSWKGMDFARNVDKDGDTPAHVADNARVYNNKDADKQTAFSKEYPVGSEDHSGNGEGYLLTGNVGTADVDLAARRPITGTDISGVKIPTFTEQGTQNRRAGENEVAYRVRGTFDGAPGRYECTGTPCSSTVNRKGELTTLGGNWNFKPDEGAMVSTPDDTYLYFGWWVSKDSKGVPEVASAFAGLEGTANAANGITAGWVAGAENAPTAGSATYNGSAAGKYSFNDKATGTGHGGHFTADAALTAVFDAGGDAETGISGTIDNFKLNDGSTNPNWSVSLNRIRWGTGAGEFTSPDDDDESTADVNESLTTTWSINDNKADASGTWSGTMYDEKPGNAPDGDGSNIPTTVIGTFYSEFESRGRMVGAFGAER